MNVICKRFCILPNEIASYINSVAFRNGEYSYILIGVIKAGDDYQFCGIDKKINMDNIVQSAINQVKVKTKITYEICNVGCKKICVIKVKTCEKLLRLANADCKLKKVLKDLLSACIKLQANSFYYTATEDQRNDYIRDVLETAGYDVKDQTRRGLSPSGKAAGEVDILIKENNLPLTIIEALNLDSLNVAYLDKHIDKIYDYDTAGNAFNILLSYVTVANFSSFCDKYIQHIKIHTYPYSLISMEDNFMIEEFLYSDMKVVKTVHNRNNCETVLFHVVVCI